MNPIIFIPARLGSTRLPGKALALISGKPMIAHVLARGMEADLGPVVVATDAREIAEAVEAAGGRAVMTAGAHACGLDRIGEALGRIDPARKYDVVVDLQGDQPFLPSGAIGAALALLGDRRVDMATLATLALPGEEDDPDVVKMVGSQISPNRLRALYFTRARAPFGEGPYLSSSRRLRLSSRGVRAIRRPARFAAGETRAARTTPRARGRHAHRRRPAGQSRAVGGYGARPRRGAPGR